MPLRDHFRAPLDDMRHWEGFHATWPVMIVALLGQSLGLGQPLPTMPLWLADDLAVPLALNESYEQSCTILNIP